MKQPELRINGERYPNLPQLLAIYEEQVDELQRKFGPTHLSRYAHGDLPLRNIFRMPNGAVKITDVRGRNIHPTSPSTFSVEFDLAKIAHSFFLELVRNHLYELSARQEEDGSYTFRFRFYKTPGVTRYLQVWRQFPAMLRQNQALGELFRGKAPGWLEHVVLGAAINLACDGIHRLSQDPSGHDSVMYYLQATVELYDFLFSRGLLLQSKPVRERLVARDLSGRLISKR
jgi:hypothetical protein